MDQGSESRLDADVADAVAAGDTELFAVLVQRHQRAVRGAVSWLLDPVAIENFVQQTFVNAFEKLDQFRREDDFALWARGIARNLVRQEMRRRSREIHHLSLYQTYVLQRLDGQSDDDAEFESQRATLTACRKELIPAAGQAVELRYTQGFDMETIARTMGRSVPATRQLLHRARLLLRDCMQRKAALT